jgi:hypothetical protein
MDKSHICRGLKAKRALQDVKLVERESGEILMRTRITCPRIGKSDLSSTRAFASSPVQLMRMS